MSNQTDKPFYSELSKYIRNMSDNPSNLIEKCTKYCSSPDRYRCPATSDLVKTIANEVLAREALSKLLTMDFILVGRDLDNLGIDAFIHLPKTENNPLAGVDFKSTTSRNRRKKQIGKVGFSDPIFEVHYRDSFVMRFDPFSKTYSNLSQHGIPVVVMTLWEESIGLKRFLEIIYESDGEVCPL